MIFASRIFVSDQLLQRHKDDTCSKELSPYFSRARREKPWRQNKRSFRITDVAGESLV
jgi:hypothetical protein